MNLPTFEDVRKERFEHNFVMLCALILWLLFVCLGCSTGQDIEYNTPYNHPLWTAPGLDPWNKM